MLAKHRKMSEYTHTLVLPTILLRYQARTEYLRRKARAALQDGREDGDGSTAGDAAVEHLNLFPLEESSEKKGNEEYLKEKKEEKVSALFILPHSGVKRSCFYPPAFKMLLVFFVSSRRGRSELLGCWCPSDPSQGPRSLRGI